MKKWTRKEMLEHGWVVYYYNGWRVDLCAPKKLSDQLTVGDRDDFYEYCNQKIELINSLPETVKLAINTLQKIHDLGNTRSGKSAESRIAYEILVELGLPLENGDD